MSADGPRLLLDERPESLTDAVYEVIRDGIMKNTLPPGVRVTEAGLAGELNVSKTPVREALLKLRQIGLIEEDGRRGWRVVRPSVNVINHAYEFREALETFAVRLVAERASPEEIARINHAAERSVLGAQVGSHEEFRNWDFAFHRGIAETTRNPLIVDGIDNVFSLIVTLRERDLPHIHFHIECGESHTNIAAALARHDIDLAQQEMRAHVHQVRDYVLSNFANRIGLAEADSRDLK